MEILQNPQCEDLTIGKYVSDVLLKVSVCYYL